MTTNLMESQNIKQKGTSFSSRFILTLPDFLLPVINKSVRRVIPGPPVTILSADMAINEETYAFRYPTKLRTSI